MDISKLHICNQKKFALKIVNLVGDLGGADDKTAALIQGIGSNYKSKAVVIN